LEKKMSIATESIVDSVRSAFGFEVEKFPLAGPDGLHTPWYGLFRSDNGGVVGNGSVSSKYVPHTTEDVIALVDAASVVFEGVADVDCYFRDGHYVVIQPTKEQRFQIHQADSVFPRIMIRAGYDGKAFKASIGSFRDLCSNLHIMRKVSGVTVSIRHSSNLRDHMKSLIDQFQQLQTGWDSVTNAIQRMEANRVSMVNFLDAIYGKPDPDSKRSVTEHQNRTEAIFKRLQRETTARGETIGADFTVSGWLAFNAVQGFIQHETTRKGRNKGSDGAGLLLSLNDANVLKAEELALAV
jgi:hypothetical protein